jgi:hypothetical protein
MAITLVQANNTSFIATNPAATWTSNNTAGNLLIAMGVCRSAFTGSISDGANTWVPLFTGLTAAGTSSNFNVWYAANCLGSGSPRTVTFTTTWNNNGLVIAEFSGVNRLDLTSAAGFPTTSPYTSPALTASAANSLYIGVFGNSSGSLAVSAGTTLAGLVPSFAALVYNIASAQSSTTLGMTGSGTGFGTIATFINAPTGVPNSLMLMGCGT